MVKRDFTTVREQHRTDGLSQLGYPLSLGRMVFTASQATCESVNTCDRLYEQPTGKAEMQLLQASHAAQVQAMRAAHQEELRQLKDKAVQAAEARVELLRRVFKEKAARHKECLATAVLYLWRFRVRRQAEARQRWRGFSAQLRFQAEPNNPTYRDIFRGPRMTIARRLALLHRDPSDLEVPHALTGRQIASMVLQVWRSYAYIKRQTEKVDALTEAVPTFMENLGDRRRLERAWLALRLWTAGAATRRAHQAIDDYEAATAEARAARVVAEAARATADMATAGMEEERGQQQRQLALLGVDAATTTHAFASTQAGNGFNGIGVSGGLGGAIGVGVGVGGGLTSVATGTGPDSGPGCSGVGGGGGGG
ncbi:hypothetical protein Vafri_11142, partial [Volvox africanus]